MAIEFKHKAGELFGDVEYLGDVRMMPRPTGGTSRISRFKCKCGREFETIFNRVKSGKTTSCGCNSRRYTPNSNAKYKGHLKYDTWCGIKMRCYTKSNKAYKYYGAKGIIMCEEWKNNFLSFYSYVSKLPNFNLDGYTLDRINNKGNYEPNNVRWATQQEQYYNSSACIKD